MEDLCISRADPETSLLQQIILPYLTNQGGNPEQHRNKTDTYSDFKATVFSDQIRDTGAKDLWPAEAKSDNPITSEEDFKYGDTMHAVGDSDFEDDEDLQEFSQVDAPLVSDAPSKQPNTDANIAGFIDESSSFEQSNTGDMNTFESQKFEIGERKSFSEKNVSSKGNPDDDSPSASVQTEEDHKDSGSEYDFVEMVSKNEKVVSGEDQKDSTDRESGKSVMPTQLYITEEVKKDSESNEDDDGSRGVPEYNSGDESEQGEIGSSSKQDVVESSTAECFLPSETERNDGNFTIQGTSSSASNSRATITRLSHVS